MDGDMDEDEMLAHAIAMSMDGEGPSAAPPPLSSDKSKAAQVLEPQMGAPSSFPPWESSLSGENDSELAQAIALSMASAMNPSSNLPKSSKPRPTPRDVLFTIPPEVLTSILRKVSPREAFILRLVSKRTKELATSSEVWEYYYLSRYGEPPQAPQTNATNSEASVNNQLLAYRQRHMKQFHQTKSYFVHYRTAGWSHLMNLDKTPILPLSSFTDSSIERYHVIHAETISVDNLKKEAAMGFRSGMIYWKSLSGKYQDKHNVINDVSIQSIAIKDNEVCVGETDGNVTLYTKANEGLENPVFKIKLQEKLSEVDFDKGHVVILMSGRELRVFSRGDNLLLYAIKGDRFRIAAENPGMMLNVCGAGLSIINISKNIAKYSADVRDIVKASYPDLPPEIPFVCTHCDFKYHIVATLFREGKPPVGFHKFMSFDVLILWNTSSSVLTICKLIFSHGASVKFLKIDESLDRVVLGLSDGTFQFISTITGKTYFKSEPILPFMATAEASATDIVVGTDSGKTGWLQFSGFPGLSQSAKEIYVGDHLPVSLDGGISVQEWIVIIRKKMFDIRQLFSESKNDEAMAVIERFFAHKDQLLVSRHFPRHITSFIKKAATAATKKKEYENLRPEIASTNSNWTYEQSLERLQNVHNLYQDEVSEEFPFPVLVEPLRNALELMREIVLKRYDQMLQNLHLQLKQIYESMRKGGDTNANRQKLEKMRREIRGDMALKSEIRGNSRSEDPFSFLTGTTQLALSTSTDCQRRHGHFSA
eukprot:TRINITY_DN3194_c0_g2_i2.p1 TRINITY_DN3194_c0_g2~~TRINITY_DN3194_c0_g2_i2.p1  ORF type:complete len:764 (+),score=173.54 TRINITY_DN3194_c0_g2_i2:114-2405(+)